MGVDGKVVTEIFVPKGTVVISANAAVNRSRSIWGADAREWKPERWLDPKGLANANPKNYLVFGAGPHRCIGQEYVTLNMSMTLGLAVTMMTFEHEITKDSEEIAYVPPPPPVSESLD